MDSGALSSEHSRIPQPSQVHNAEGRDGLKAEGREVGLGRVAYEFGCRAPLRWLAGLSWLSERRSDSNMIATGNLPADNNTLISTLLAGIIMRFMQR
jgi:hypothetical protein